MKSWSIQTIGPDVRLVFFLAGRTSNGFSFEVSSLYCPFFVGYLERTCNDSTSFWAFEGLMTSRIMQNRQQEKIVLIHPTIHSLCSFLQNTVCIYTAAKQQCSQ